MIQFIGYLAGAILAVALIPQVYKSYKSKSTKDLSLMWSLILAMGLLLYTVYGVGIQEMPIIIMSSIELALTLSLVIAKLIYK